MKLFNLLCLFMSIFSFALSAPLLDSPIPPSDDPFYKPPDNFASAKLGDVLKIRKTPFPLRSVFLEVNVKNSWQIMVRLSDSHGNPTGIVSTIIEPYNSDGTKFVSYQVAEDSSSRDCAPSYSMQYGAGGVGASSGSNLNSGVDSIPSTIVYSSSSLGGLDSLIAQIEMFFMQVALNNGWWIVAPDYEGMNLTFTAGRIAGHSVLDSIRGVLKLTNGTLAGLVENPQVAMWGYSGGSLATGWAAALQPLYAPELSKHLVGAAVGGFVTNITETIVAVDNTLYAGLVPNGISGLSNEYPEILPTVMKYLDPSFLGRFTLSRDSCLLTSVVYTIFSTMFKGPPGARLWFPTGYEILNEPIIQKTIMNVTLGVDKNEMPEIPLFVYHGLDDHIVPSENTFRIYDTWKSQGIKSMEVAISNSTRHITEMLLGCPAAVTWLEKAFAGNTINGTLFTYRYTNLDYPDSSQSTIDLIYGAIRTILNSPLGPLLGLDASVSTNTTNPVLNARGFEDYDEIAERILTQYYLRR